MTERQKLDLLYKEQQCNDTMFINDYDLTIEIKELKQSIAKAYCLNNRHKTI